MNTWFVGTVDKLPGTAQFGLIWSMREFDNESAARRYARDALSKGLRVEAGTLTKVRPEIHVRWRECSAWVVSGDA